MSRRRILGGAGLLLAAAAGVFASIAVASPTGVLSLIGIVQFTHAATATVGRPLTYTIDVTPTGDVATIENQLDFSTPVVPICGSAPQNTTTTPSCGFDGSAFSGVLWPGGESRQLVGVVRPTEAGTLTAHYVLCNAGSCGAAEGTDDVTVVPAEGSYDHVWDFVPAGGTLATTSPSDVVPVTVAVPPTLAAGAVPISIDEWDLTTSSPPTGFSFGEHGPEVQILDGGVTADAGDPFVITFVTDASVQAIFQDDGSGPQQVPVCPAAGAPVPPCDTSAQADPSGPKTWTVYTTQFSIWNFAAPATPGTTSTQTTTTATTTTASTTTTTAAPPNHAPAVVLDNAPASIDEGSSVELHATGSDPDGDPLAYAWTTNNGTIAGSGDTVSWTAGDGPANATVSVTVFDNHNGAGKAAAVIAVANVAPTVNAGPAHHTFWGLQEDFNGSATDPSDADARSGLQPVWSFGDGASANGVSASHTYEKPGTYTATLSATDKDGGTGQATTPVEVDKRPATLQIDAPSDVTVAQDFQVKVKLLDDADPTTADLAGREISLEVNGDEVAQKVTDASGAVTLDGFIPALGNVTVTASLAGDAKYEDANATATVKVSGYTLRTIPTTDSYADVTAINSCGDVAGGQYHFGSSGVPGMQVAYLYDSQADALTTLGGDGSWANGLNDLGDVVGYDNLGGRVWSGAVQAPGPAAEVFGINDTRELVGTSAGGHAFLDTPSGGYVDLQPVLSAALPAYTITSSSARAINDTHQVVGDFHGRLGGGANADYSFLYDETTGKVSLIGPRTLSPTGPFPTDAGVAAINDSGTIIGRQYFATGTADAFILGQTPVDLSKPDSGSADGINNQGAIVGEQNGHATLWRVFEGQSFSIDLNAAVTNLDGVSLENAAGINNAGEIVADDGAYAYLLVPEKGVSLPPCPVTITRTTLSTSPTASKIGDSVTLTATISPSTATGTVTFSDGSATLGAANLSSGAAQLSVPFKSAGLHRLTAVYRGDASFSPSSNWTVQRVFDPNAHYDLEAGNANGDCQDLGGSWQGSSNTCAVGSAPLELASTNTLTIGAGVTLEDTGTIDDAGTIDNGGTIEITVGDAVRIDSGGTIVDEGTIDDAGTIDNGGTLEITIGDAVRIDSGGKVVDEGTIDDRGSIENDGVLEIEFGAPVRVESGGTIDDGGSIDNAGDLELQIGAAVRIDSGGKVVDDGTIDDSGSIENDGTVEIKLGTPVRVEDGGAIDNAGTITNDGTIETDGGTIDDTGSIENHGQLVVTLGAIEITGGTLDNAGSVVNDGTISADGGTIEDSGSLENDGKMTLTLDEVEIVGGGSIENSGSIDNSGKLVLTQGEVEIVGGGSIENSGSIENHSKLSVEVGEIEIIGGGSVVSDGAMSLSLDGVMIIDETSTVNTTGTVDDHGTITNRGSWTAPAGSMTTIETGGTFVNDGTFANSGSLIVEGEFIDGGGALRNLGGVTIESGGLLLNKNDGATITNGGTITVRSGGTLDNGGSLANSGAITVESAGGLVREPGSTYTGNRAVEPDATPPTVSCVPPDASTWYGSDVVLACAASDDGSGLANAGDGSFSLTTSVASGSVTDSAATNSRRVCDNAGNCATAGPYTFKVDRKPPSVMCAAADGAWHAENVSVACSASDDGAGLANAGDASFTLSTSVQAGAETPNAQTESRRVCDSVGNCATAGPIGGNKVDRKPPALTLPAGFGVDATSPSGATVAYTASASDGTDPNPTLSCSPLSGTTFAIGSTTVRCTATDHVGNTAGGGFTVTVRGARQQLAELVRIVAQKAGLPAAPAALLHTLDGASDAQLCVGLKAFATVVQALSHHALDAATAAEWTARADRIRAVLACR